MTDLPPPLRGTNWGARLRRLGDTLGALVSRAWLRRAAGLTVRLQLTEAELTRALQTGSTSATDVIQRAAAVLAAAGGEFSDELAELARAGVVDGVSLGIEAARGMIGAQDGAVLLNFRSPTPEMARQLERIVTSPAFRASVERFGADIAAKAADMMLYGLANGYNPRRIAGLLTSYIGSVPKVWAETTARTAQLYAYRRATHETYRQNADILEGWQWYAALDSRTCLSCISLHGQVFPLSEELNDHHRGRCVAIGVVRGTTWAADVQTGPAWFAELDTARQREMMGPGLYTAYASGVVDWTRMSRVYQNDIYGAMRRQATLAEMGIARAR